METNSFELLTVSLLPGFMNCLNLVWRFCRLAGLLQWWSVLSRQPADASVGTSGKVTTFIFIDSSFGFYSPSCSSEKIRGRFLIQNKTVAPDTQRTRQKFEILLKYLKSWLYLIWCMEESSDRMWIWSDHCDTDLLIHIDLILFEILRSAWISAMPACLRLAYRL